MRWLLLLVSSFLSFPAYTATNGAPQAWRVTALFPNGFPAVDGTFTSDGSSILSWDFTIFSHDLFPLSSQLPCALPDQHNCNSASFISPTELTFRRSLSPFMTGEIDIHLSGPLSPGAHATVDAFAFYSEAVITRASTVLSTTDVLTVPEPKLVSTLAICMGCLPLARWLARRRGSGKA